jgi:glycosyltransferase involved in cell wall biosynthesis
MRVLLLSRYGRKGASSRLRHEQFIPALAEAGIEVVGAPFLPDDYLTALYDGRSWPVRRLAGRYVERLSRLADARRADLIWLEKEAFPWLPFAAERLFLSAGPPLVVDYDDAWRLRYRNHRLSPVRCLLGNKLDRVMAAAAAVVVGNRVLADQAQAAGARRVEIFPTVVDAARYPVRFVDGPTMDGGPPVAGWIGTPATAGYLRAVAAPLNRLTAEGRLRVRVVGATAASLPELTAEFLPWSEAAETELVAGFDIGLMPLPDTPWEQGKCAYKLIQCMACAKPVIASPVGANCEVIDDGVDGRLASDTAQWAQALESLAADAGLRRRMGEAGRAKVEARYSLSVTAPRMVALLRDVASA